MYHCKARSNARGWTQVFSTSYAQDALDYCHGYRQIIIFCDSKPILRFVHRWKTWDGARWIEVPNTKRFIRLLGGI